MSISTTFTLLPWAASQSRSGLSADCTGGCAKAMISTTGCAAWAAGPAS
jgi:hypothetical protein